MINPTTTLNVTMNLVVANGDCVPLPAQLQFSNRDPVCVSAVFIGDGMEVEWVFSRELLNVGSVKPIGDGDVHIWPTGESVAISLSSPDGQAVLECSKEKIGEFLVAIYEDAPVDGEEALYESLIDDFLEKILPDE